MAYFPPTGSVVGFQSDPTKLLTHSSVSGRVTADAGIVPGSIVAFQGAGWSGSVVAVQSGAVRSSVEGMQAVGAAVASRPIQVGGKDIDGSVVGARFARDGDTIVQFHASVIGLVDNVSNQVAIPVGVDEGGFTVTPVMNYVFDGTTWDRVRGNSAQGTQVFGSVATVPSGTVITSLVSTVPSSVIIGTSIFGQLPGGTAVLGSVAALQGTNPWVVNFSNSSIIAINAGSVITINPGSIITIQQANSIVGTYAEDAAHTTADKGIFTLGVRNDAIASFVSANLDYGPIATDAAGRTTTKPFAPEESRVEGYSSTVNVSVTTLVAAAGAGLRNYITDVMIANTGATTTLVTFKSGGGASILGYTIAPTGGGSNMIGFATPIRTGVNQTFDFQATSGTSILYATVKGFKAP